jgi:hypothetical protein
MRLIIPLLLLYFCTAEAIAQCDAKVEPSDNTVLRYRARGDRCEGFYRSKVSSTGLELVSCTLGDFRFKNEPGEIITLQAPSAGEQPVSVRAQGIPITLYYRMDTELKAGQTLNWAAGDVLLKDPSTSRAYNIGLFAFRGEGVTRTYLPVATRSKLLAEQATSKQVIVKFMATGRLANFSWQLNGGGWQSEIGPFPDGRAIRVALPAELKPGRHTLEVRYRAQNETETKTRRFVLQR